MARDQPTPKELMHGAMFVALFWCASAVGALIRHNDADVRLYLLLANLWVAVMFLGRYIQRTQR